MSAVRQALPAPAGADAAAYLDLLSRRLETLATLAAGDAQAASRLAPGAGSRALVRRVLGPLEGRWDDGDENRVRGHLDRWVRPGDDERRAAARHLIEAADALAVAPGRPETLWFFLWALESAIEGLVGPRRR